MPSVSSFDCGYCPGDGGGVCTTAVPTSPARLLVVDACRVFGGHNVDDAGEVELIVCDRFTRLAGGLSVVAVMLLGCGRFERGACFTGTWIPSAVSDKDFLLVCMYVLSTCCCTALGVTASLVMLIVE